MKKYLFVVAAALAFGACTSDRQGPLIGNWKLSSVEARPAGTASQQHVVGAIYTFRADSTFSINAAPAGRYELKRLPEGLFLELGAGEAVKYRVSSMTPSELNLHDDRDGRQVDLRLEYQRQ